MDERPLRAPRVPPVHRHGPPPSCAFLRSVVPSRGELLGAHRGRREPGVLPIPATHAILMALKSGEAVYLIRIRTVLYREYRALLHSIYGV